ncbi:MAG: prefoldin subunit beta [Nanoarchaeota archaeon]|nr:prefoldin subunit beta [Nanoarchaeota archaeon]
MNKELENKMGKIQLLEQNIQNFSMQKQTFQGQLLEAENALKELDKSKGAMFKIVGNIMVSSDKESLKKDLESKKEIYNLRIKSIAKQENSLKEKIKDLQEEILEEMKKRDKSVKKND